MKHDSLLKRFAPTFAKLCFFTICLAAFTSAQPPRTGTIQQGLVGGTEVTEKMQEYYGLLKFEMGSGFCSASLLRNDWAISAAHCVDAKDANRKTTPDRARPGQNVLKPLAPMRLIAAWGGGQTRTVTRVETFWPYDVALIKLNSPVQVNGKTTGFVREVFFDQFPLFGSPVTANLTVFGAGINQFATGSGSTATMSSSDEKFRMGTARVQRDEGTLYWYPAGDNMVAGGDSGGPSFTTAGTSRSTVLVGVHALTHTERVKGRENEPGWDWVTATPEAADAPIKPVWRQIEQIMGPLPVIPITPEPFQGRHSAVFEQNGFSRGTGDVEENILYGVHQNGDLIWHLHYIDQRPGRRLHSFAPTKRIGNGWKGGYQGAYPGGAKTIYTLDDAGNLQWRWHTGAFEGTPLWRPQALTVATGWAKENVIPMDQGVVYTVSRSGTQGILRWHRHRNYMDGQGGEGGWERSKDVNKGFGQYIAVFSGGNGILYGLTLDGRLYWYKHKDYLRPVPLPATIPAGIPQKTVQSITAQWNVAWEGPKKVADGWGMFAKLFSPGGGHIYGVTASGDLMYFRHTGYLDGSYRWDDRFKGKIASGWNGYASAFARITTSDNHPGHPEFSTIVK